MSCIMKNFCGSQSRDAIGLTLVIIILNFSTVALFVGGNSFQLCVLIIGFGVMNRTSFKRRPLISMKTYTERLLVRFLVCDRALFLH